MAIYTQLSAIATPGGRHVFAAKTPAGEGAKGEGLFTALSAIATPGGRHVFAVKTPSGAGEKGIGPFTAQSVLAVPGARHSFTAKEFAGLPAPPLPPSLITVGGGGSVAGWPEKPEWEYKERLRKRILRDDQEIIEIIMAMVLSGGLN